MFFRKFKRKLRKNYSFFQKIVHDIFKEQILYNRLCLRQKSLSTIW